MKTYKLNYYGEEIIIALHEAKYSHDKGLAIAMLVVEDGMRVDTWDYLTTNLDETKPESRKAFVEKGKYEDFIKENDLGKPTGEIAYSGFNTYVEYDFKIGIDK